jgi:hypothetical protein
MDLTITTDESALFMHTPGTMQRLKKGAPAWACDGQSPCLENKEHGANLLRLQCDHLQQICPARPNSELCLQCQGLQEFTRQL